MPCRPPARALRHCPFYIALLLVAGCQSPPPPAADSILLITVDTWRADHLDPLHSPNLWGIAQQGWRFTNAWTPIGLTSPAHATLFTGQLPWRHGMRANNHHGAELSADALSLAEHARDAGWSTAAFVSAWPAGPTGGLDQGFDLFEGPDAGERAGQQTVDEALSWLDTQPRDAPFFLWVHVFEPHGPYNPPREHLLAVGAATDGSADDSQKYGGEVHLADHLLLPLLERWRTRPGLLLVAGDHGEILHEEVCGFQHERSTHEAVLRVPLFLAGPGIQARVDDEWVGLDDVAATVVARVGLPPWPADNGHDLAAPHKQRQFWQAESGLCEPDCAPGCQPVGLLGRDRVVIGDGWRVTHRPGRGLLTEGAVPAQEVWRPLLAGLPPMLMPAGQAVQEQAQALGYQE